MRNKTKIWLYSISIIAILSMAICIPTVVTLAGKSVASKAEAAREAVVSSADVAEAVAYAQQRVIYRYVDRETDVVCYFVLNDRAWATGGIDCIPSTALHKKGRDFVINY